MKDWTLERLKGASIAPIEATYKAIPETVQQRIIALTNPELFTFQAISIGDDEGQAFIVPMDESGKGTVELIFKALAQYDPSEEEV